MTLKTGLQEEVHRSITEGSISRRGATLDGEAEKTDGFDDRFAVPKLCPRPFLSD